MIQIPFKRTQRVIASILATAIAALLTLAPAFLKQDVEPSSITRFSSPVSLSKLPPKQDEQEPPPPEPERPEPEPIMEEPVALMEFQTPNVSPIQPELLDISISSNLSQAIPVSLPKGAGALSLGDVDEPPVPIYTPPPMYPEKARRRRLQAKLLLQMVIKKDGTVANVKVKSGEHGEVFSRVALRTVTKWKFQPARLKGKAVNVLVTLPLEFSWAN